jgi:hypothetical protein
MNLPSKFCVLDEMEDHGKAVTFDRAYFYFVHCQKRPVPGRSTMLLARKRGIQNPACEASL